MGMLPARPVAALRESVSAIRRLLAGETVTLAGKERTLREIAITHPAVEDVPIAMGVSGPMLLSLAGELADTTLLKPVAMANLLGDLWLDGEPNWARALDHPAVKLHLYGKAKPMRGRKS